MTEIRLFGRDDIAGVLALDVGPGRDSFVAPNAVTIAQSIFEHGSELFTIRDEDQIVGLLAIVDMAHPKADLDDGDDPDGIYIWRLLIDAKEQGKGYGRAAVRHAIGLAQERGRAQLVVSAVPDNAAALSLYETEGFKPSGRLVDGEIEVIRHPA